MKVKTYQQLCARNEGFAPVRRSLKALAKVSPLQPAEVRRLAQFAAEACAATNSYLFEALGAEATDQAGRLFVRRKARERKEERG